MWATAHRMMRGCGLDAHDAETLTQGSDWTVARALYAPPAPVNSLPPGKLGSMDKPFKAVFFLELASVLHGRRATRHQLMLGGCRLYKARQAADNDRGPRAKQHTRLAWHCGNPRNGVMSCCVLNVPCDASRGAGNDCMHAGVSGSALSRLPAAHAVYIAEHLNQFTGQQASTKQAPTGFVQAYLCSSSTLSCCSLAAW
jgi:hypothetical protein